MGIPFFASTADTSFKSISGAYVKITRSESSALKGFIRVLILLLMVHIIVRLMSHMQSLPSHSSENAPGKQVVTTLL